MKGALSGVVVLDLTRFLSGPYCTLLLAGMGAEVIKVDDPAGGDPTAKAPPFAGPQGVSLQKRTESDFGLAYLKRARGKKSITLDLKQPQGRDLLRALAAKADVLVENFRPGVAARIGADYATLSRDNPRLVHCSLTGYGSSGPDSHLKAYDLMAQAAAGLMGISGEPDGPPAKAGSAISDCIAGAYSALGIVAALNERNRSGKGQAVDVSMTDCLFSLVMDEPLDCYAQLGLSPRQGNRIMRFSPFNAYATKDGWATIGCATREEWTALLEAMGREELKQDADMMNVGWRIANNAAVDRIVGDWAAGFETAALVALLLQHDVACSPVRSPQDLMDWEHLRARGMLRPLAQPDGTQAGVAAAGFPLKFSRSEANHDTPAPMPGAHTGDVLARFLGTGAEDLERLRRDGVV
ncbi:MAG: CaiB/BaiF CoA transferase family protein [Betaproteobacteria bacterium]